MNDLYRLVNRDAWWEVDNRQPDDETLFAITVRGRYDVGELVPVDGSVYQAETDDNYPIDSTESGFVVVAPVKGPGRYVVVEIGDTEEPTFDPGEYPGGRPMYGM
jgi:hypothetical protein